MHRGGSGEKEKPPPAASAQTSHEPASLNVIFKQFHRCRLGSELGNCCLFLTEWDLERGGFCSRLEVFSLAAFEIFERSNVYLMGRREAHILLGMQLSLSIYRTSLKLRQKMQNRNKNFSGSCAVTVSKMKSDN